MLFNSWQFLIFFPVVSVLYFVLPHKGQLFLLLAASFIFYMAFIPQYALILIALILIDYFTGRVIEKSQGKRRKIFLLASLLSNIIFLGIFKYFNFFNSNFGHLLPTMSLILPIGLSFHTFQAMAYTIEVYRKKVKAEHNLLHYALYVMFFPQLVAGPIERPQNLLPQFKFFHRFNYQDAIIGLRLVLWGLLKKMVIADNLAPYVADVFRGPQSQHGITLILGTVFFAIQIYCDFSGYTDVAIGAARVLGFKLMQNFNYPYFSKNISEFWQRWHISLSSWFRDYVYIPLGGNRKHWLLNILIVFILSGFWHGANWTYILWGACHAGLYLFFDWFRKLANYFITFGAVCVAWIFFRAENLNDAFFILTHLTYGVGGYMRYLISKGRMADIGQLTNPFTITSAHNEVWILIIMLILFMLFEYLRYKGSMFANFMSKKIILRWGLYALVVLLIINFGATKEAPFIYFQF